MDKQPSSISDKPKLSIISPLTKILASSASSVCETSIIITLRSIPT
ncbi:uncharacterized protein METZ01_LOCUS7943 [marine metagenome]|uniref:Uncharacterized protein n=1 Tax=marine metagenome TaxID=408172 RepID=A0A381NL46_9ZZZZ